MSLFSSPWGGNTDSAAPAAKYGSVGHGGQACKETRRGNCQICEVETVAKHSINLQKFKPDGAE